MKKTLAAFAIALLAVITISDLPSSSVSTVKQYIFCAKKASGDLRYANSCKSTETKLVLNPFSPVAIPSPSAAPSTTPSPTQVAPSSKSLVVEDANGNIFGYPLSAGDVTDQSTNVGLNSSVTALSIFVPSVGKVVFMNMSGKPTYDFINFSSTDCTGTAVSGWTFPNSSGMIIAVKRAGATAWYKLDSTTGSTTFVRGSYVDQSGTCVTRSGTVGMDGDGNLAIATPTSAPFSDPPGPLRLAVR